MRSAVTLFFLPLLLPSENVVLLPTLTTQVTINAVENSASVASMVLTTECLIAELPVELNNEQEQQQYDAMGGGNYM